MYFQLLVENVMSCIQESLDGTAKERVFINLNGLKVMYVFELTI